MNIYDASKMPCVITIGYDGENNWRPQSFDCASLLENHPNGTLTLWILPHSEEQAFPVALSRDGNVITWTPLSEELVGRGGALQIVCTDGTDVGKSAIALYRVSESVVPGAEHPAATPSWATQTVERAEAAADRAEEAADSIDIEALEAQIAQAVEDYLEEHPVSVTVDSALSSTSENPVQNKVVKAALDAKADKTTLLNLLIPILRQGLYGEDQDAAISALETALGGTPPVQAYVITNDLTNVTNSNEATAINSGTAYTAALTPAEGMEIQSVAVTMGGVDVTSTVYSNGTISIASVTGNIVITAVAESLIETYTPTMIAGYYIVANGTEYDHTSYTRTPVIPCREGDKVYGTCTNSNYPGVPVNYIRARWTTAYDNNGNAIESAGSNVQTDWSQASPYVVPSGVYGMVFSMVNALANDVVIYVDKSERVGA